MKYCLFFFAILTGPVSFAQNQDHLWILGYGGGGQSGPNDINGLSILRFDGLNQINIVNNQTCDLNMSGANSSMNDSTGNLLFTTNGEKVYNSNYTLMSNGNNLNVSNSYGARQPQGSLSLPIPDQKDKYLMLINEDKYFSTELLYAGYKIYKNIIDMSESNGLGNVIEKKVEMIQDTLELGQITAVKHANGRDWWILVPESYSNRYYTMLLDPAGLSIVDTQSIGIPFIDGLGQAVFSPNGKKYARTNGVKLSQPTHLYAYDFDRSIGKLTNPIHLEYETWGLGTGCAISPNSRFLYAINASYVFQYDLEAPDIEASKVLVAEWDGYVRNGQFPTTFSMAQLAPDGKIYISCPNSNPYLHVIKYPNKKGAACEVVQRGIELPNLNDYSIPNFPNFRLGPIDGSACDTLGFDNHPLCNWRWEQEDSLAPLQVTFTDLSSYEPSSWHWDFGDGTVSQDTSPVHTYPSAGSYQVCLVVSNPYSADTMCQMITIGNSSSAEAPQIRFVLFPNPARDWLEISAIGQQAPALFEIFDLNGIRLLSQTISDDSKAIAVTQLPSGMYFYRIFCRDRWTQSGKVVIAR